MFKKIELNGKLFFYFALFVSFVFGGLINFDEELLFLLTFVTMVFTAVFFVGQSLSLQLDLAISLIVKDFIVLAASKALSLSTIKEFSSDVKTLSKDIEDLALYTRGVVNSSIDTYEKDFNYSFQLLKHKQLKLLVLEGLQFVKLLYVRGFFNYWKELKEIMVNMNFGEASLLPSIAESEFAFLQKELRDRVNSIALFGYNADVQDITYLDIILVTVLLKILNKNID